MLKRYKYLLSLIILLLIGTPLAQAKKIKSPFPNTVPVESDYLYAGQTEVSNLQYREFLSYVKKTKDMDYYWSMQPDTNIWRAKLGLMDPFRAYYFQHPAYAEYPLVGVTHYQAKEYCKWLESILSQNLPKGIKKIQVRLPTKKEWEDAARGGHPEYTLPMGKDKYRMGEGDKNKDKGKHLYNYTIGKNLTTNYKKDDGYPLSITTPVFSYWANPFNLYNMSGNVAEMVLEDSIVKGGSWSSTGYFLQIGNDNTNLNSTIPSSEIGFRYFIEVIEYDYAPFCTAFKSKWITKEMVKVAPNLYAHETECSNLDFRRFWTLYPEYMPKDSNWFIFGAKDYAKKYSWNPDYFKFPVVNISYEAAVAYCAWLTEKTNADPKRKYAKVSFRLPSKAEWESAALGGDSSFIYPWGGDYIRNSKGAFLANFCPIPEMYSMKENGEYNYALLKKYYFDNKEIDGGEFLVEGKAYFPNKYGLYNVSGNAAEMLQENGTSKGGSWGSSSGFLQLKQTVDKKTPYFFSRVYLPNSKTSPFLGFRVFMEVLEN